MPQQRGNECVFRCSYVCVLVWVWVSSCDCNSTYRCCDFRYANTAQKKTITTIHQGCSHPMYLIEWKPNLFCRGRERGGWSTISTEQLLHPVCVIPRPQLHDMAFSVNNAPYPPTQHTSRQLNKQPTKHWKHKWETQKAKGRRNNKNVGQNTTTKHIIMAKLQLHEMIIPCF